MWLVLSVELSSRKQKLFRQRNTQYTWSRYSKRICQNFGWEQVGRFFASSKLRIVLPWGAAIGKISTWTFWNALLACVSEYVARCSQSISPSKTDADANPSNINHCQYFTVVQIELFIFAQQSLLHRCKYKIYSSRALKTYLQTRNGPSISHVR